MLVYLNGQLVPDDQARVSVFDRGFLFGDGIYEGLRATRGHIIGLDRHINRLRAGLEETRIVGFDPEALRSIANSLIDAIGIDSAFIYLQVTRGAPTDGAARARVPDASTPPTVFAFLTPLEPIDELDVPAPKHAALRPDTRWTRGHVKSISLLGGVLAALEAHDAGADDAIMHRDGFITEGTATNVIALIDNQFVTPSLKSAPMLSGVTRALLLEAAPQIIERPLTVEELTSASEIVLIGTRTMVAPVTQLDGQPVGDGAPGPMARELHAALIQQIMNEAREAAHA